MDGLMREGRLSFSKVREVTRLAGRVDEEELCELALEMTASQLARTVRAFAVPWAELADPATGIGRSWDSGPGR
ncbi:MAG: hypothetical protein EOL91_06835 [Actinobacteria bacterium]|nr:hypothetical protein [Actinomycetota bacterium]